MSGEPHWPCPDPEGVFAAFVRNAIETLEAESTKRMRPPSGSALLDDHTRRQPTPAPPSARPTPHTDWEDTRPNARMVVPDVAAIPPAAEPRAERSDDGMAPAGELDRTLGEMDVLVRYAHVDQARGVLRDLLARYPTDLILRRRVTEFFVAHGIHDAAFEVLLGLAVELRRRGEMAGYRSAREQLAVLDPKDQRLASLPVG